MKKYVVFFALFFVFLAWFVWNSSWHLPSQLIISGHVDAPADVRISWDSGSGYNDMESAAVAFGRLAVAPSGDPVLMVRRTGRKHPAARSSEVWVKLLKRSQDDHANPLYAFVRGRGRSMTAEGYLHLAADGAEVRLPLGRDYTAICFVTNEHSGIVEIDIGGDRRSYDLYAEQTEDKWVVRKRAAFAPGSFRVRVDLPRYDFRQLKIASQEAMQTFRLDSVSIVSERGEVSLPLLGSGLLRHVGFSDIPRNTRQYFHPIHFLQQLLFALLSAWLALCVFRFIRSRGSIVRVLTEGKRPAFWMMLAGGLLAFGAWLLIYWPGHFTTDSVHIWWAAKQPGYFLHDHPVMNVIFYRFLQQFWDHFAVVGVAQIFITALLGAYIFYWLHKKGVSLFVILPFYLLFITSIPVGLYSISLWKDIPFALLVVFWAFWFVKLALEKKEGGTRYSRGGIIALLLLLIALGLFRYNGIVYFVIVPIGLALFGFIPARKYLIGTVGLLILAAFLFSVMVILDRNNFVVNQSRFFIDRMMSFGAGETALRVIRQYPTLLDINIIKKKAIWYDTWYRDSGVTQWHYNFTREKGYNQWVRYLPCEPKSVWLYSLLHPLNLKSTVEPWVYLTWNPFYLLFVFPVCLLYRLFPLTAAYGFIVLSQVLILLWVLGPYNYNWRYYYFLLFSLFFLIPVAALDVRSVWCRSRVRNAEGRKGRWLTCRKSA